MSNVFPLSLSLSLPLSLPLSLSLSLSLLPQERQKAQVLLRRKADLVYKRFNGIPGVSCRRVRGAMYAFPKIELPPGAFEEAKVYIFNHFIYKTCIFKVTIILKTSAKKFMRFGEKISLRLWTCVVV